ncbi:hypothetical protein F4X86_00145 [Candidatus Saccharibacteria bacterium]|nr:hypothetical protein [Candidatus Saccharibacteria bacterium]
MKLLLTKCAACQQELQTAYKNAYCIPDRPAPPHCQACARGGRAQNVPAAKQVYYKYCDACGPGVVVYRVELSLGNRDRASAKEVFKRSCGVKHGRQSQ